MDELNGLCREGLHALDEVLASTALLIQANALLSELVAIAA